jgi:hypothetical protein
MALPGDEVSQVRITGHVLSINGVSEVPRGLFGVHATPLSPQQISDWGVEAVRVILHTPSGDPVSNRSARVLECLYDRYQPALILARPDWQEHLVQLGKRFGRRPQSGAGRRWVEFWNEPYLNWAGKPGVNYDGNLYDFEQAQTGAPMRVRVSGETLSNLVWETQKLVAVRESSKQTDYVATRYATAGLDAGDSFSRGNQSYRLERRWWGRDTTQTNWWSGTVNRELYHRMLLPFAQSLRQAAPDAEIVAGWGFHLNQDNWAAWDVLHRPLIDVAWQWIDGIDEHHYGSDTLMVAATYETAYAYALSRYGQALKFYNTEAGGALDPERPGQAAARRLCRRLGRIPVHSARHPGNGSGLPGQSRIALRA